MYRITRMQDTVYLGVKQVELLSPRRVLRKPLFFSAPPFLDNFK